jgi:hypothetical protein
LQNSSVVINFCYRIVSLLSTPDTIDVSDPIVNDKNTIPKAIQIMASIRSISVNAVISPYPTVVSVVIAQYNQARYNVP